MQYPDLRDGEAGLVRLAQQGNGHDPLTMAFADELERRVEERTSMLRRLSCAVDAAECRERYQLARMLHDDLGQTLAAVQIRLAPLCADPREDVRQACAEIARLVGEAHRATRSVTTQLAPPVLHELGLEPALEWLAEDLGRSTGLHIGVHDDGAEKPLSQDARSIVFRSVRELLTNVAKHARVDRAEVAIAREGDAMVVRVCDAGVGYTPDAIAPPTGFGLLCVRERLAFIGARLEILSAPADGTQALLHVPLAPDGVAREGTP